MTHHRWTIGGARPWAALALAAAMQVGCGGGGAGSEDGAVRSDPKPKGAVLEAEDAGAQVILRLSTPWTSQVSTTSPLPEYPRPQLVRTDWQSLNGQWQFAGASSLSSPPTGRTLAETILVPFPVQSALSGIQRNQAYMWYRRTFTVPSSWSGRRIQLNFGAVNWQAVVYVNARKVGGHTGAYDSFSFDITSALRSGTNELIVGVYSPLDSAGIPVGKQRNDAFGNPGGIVYTGAGGIWQTVWLEPTPAAHVTRLDPIPDLAAGVVDVVVQGTPGRTATVAVSAGGSPIGSQRGAVGAHIRVPVPNAHLWTPDDPFLYDLQVTLDGGDVVTGYFGMRSIGTATVGGFLRPVLNGRFVFQIGTLDQGYWPDGIYTAPTDDALRFDLEQQKALGFNMVRKHIKIEPARWYYWTDRLGLLVWQDMPSMARSPSASDKANFESELQRLVNQLKGITSIVQWEPFNEGWGEYDPARIADLVKGWDPSRLVDGNSGSSCCGTDGGNGDLIDDHIYVGPGETNLPTSTRAAVLGEFGGLGLAVPGHEWAPGLGHSYEMDPDAVTLTRRFVEVTEQLQGLARARGLSASVYTEPTDVETEENGLFTYDRQVLKVNAAQVRAANLAVIDAVSDLRTGILGSLQVTTAGFVDRSLRHQDGVAYTAAIGSSSDDLSRQDATWWIRPGLASASCHSFESRNYPGHYLRHSGDELRKDPSYGTAGFAQDATFCARAGLSGQGWSFEAYDAPGRFIRHYGGRVYIASNGGANAYDASASFAADASWRIIDPWWRAGVDVPRGTPQSFQVTTAGFTDRYLRHQNSLGYTAVVNAGSDGLTRADATFTLVPGLADRSCVSFQSRNYPTSYLRHSSFRIRLDADDGSDLFRRDATFCPQQGLSGGDVSFASYNIADRFIRHIDGEVWLAELNGPQDWDANPGSFAADAAWRVAPAWAP